MEDKYVKPGNQERGWNDPPQFSYGFQMAQGPQRNLLNKREAQSGAPPKTAPNSNLFAPPPMGIAPPPAVRPPGYQTTPPAAPGPILSQREEGSSQLEVEPDIQDVVSVLVQALAACRQNISLQVFNDVAKRLRLLQDSWSSGRLSLPVRRRMKILSLELKSGRWDSADELHRCLMVDHVTEVSQWMVGVKRLIAETRKISPELLKHLKNPEEQFQDSADLVQDSADLVQDSADLVQDSADSVQDSADSVQDSADSVQDSADSGPC